MIEVEELFLFKYKNRHVHNKCFITLAIFQLKINLKSLQIREQDISSRCNIKKTQNILYRRIQ